VVLTPTALLSQTPMQTSCFREMDFSVTDMHPIYSLYIRLTSGNLRTGFGFQLSATARYEFRVYTSGNPRRARLRFLEFGLR
jgi:hypothetical protein